MCRGCALHVPRMQENLSRGRCCSPALPLRSPQIHNIAQPKITLGWGPIICRAIFANWLVNLAVSMSARVAWMCVQWMRARKPAAQP